MPSILLILAHPDDESFFAAGTIAKYINCGVRVGVVCATRGERGSTADLCSIEELPRLREAELREATRRLGIADHDVHTLDYEDRKLSTAQPDEIRPLLVYAIRRLQPEIVITFDPNGANQHPDHVAVARFTMDAVAAASDGRWYPRAGSPHAVDRVLWTAPVPVFELGLEADITNRPGIDYLIDITAHRGAKEAALSAHRTQWPGLHRVFFIDRDPAQTLKFEAFRVGSGTRPTPAPAADFFNNNRTKGASSEPRR